MRGEVADLGMILAYGGSGFGGCAIPIPSRRGFCRIDVICEVRREDTGFFPVDPAYLALPSFLLRFTLFQEQVRSCKSKYGNS